MNANKYCELEKRERERERERERVSDDFSLFGLLATVDALVSVKH